VDANGSNEQWLGEGWNPAWSPDGAAIVFNTAVENADIGGAGGIYVMGADGSGRTRLMSHAFASPGWGDYGVCWPSWSPDGRKIAFMRVNYIHGIELHVMNADGLHPHRVASGCAEGGATWAPDGSALAFETCTHWLRVVGLEGSTPIDVTDNCVSRPEWLHEKGGFLFARRLKRGVRVFVHADGISNQLVADLASPGQPAYSDSGPVWSRRAGAPAS
jgi:Tol biopolymer transport system component